MKQVQYFLTAVCILLLSGCAGKTTTTPSHYANYNGHKVHYQQLGSGSTTLVFIHGWSCDMEFWKSQTPDFTDDYTVILMDLPGHGKSDAPEIDYTIDVFADAVKAVLDDSNTDKAVVIGHSMGFAVAWRFGIKYPDQTAGICSVDGAFVRIPDDPAELAMLQQILDGMKAGFNGPDRKAFLSAFLEGMYTERTPPQLREYILGKMSATPEYVGNSAMNDLMNFENWRDLPVLDVPTLAIHVKTPDYTEKDRAFLHDKFSKLEYHEIEGYGHFFMMEDPTYFNKTLKVFLEANF